MTHNGVVTAEGRLTDWVSLGVLASFVPRDAVDDAVAAARKRAKRSDGKVPPHVVVYLVMALALFADDDYVEVAERLTETLALWGCWDRAWAAPTSGGITQARHRLGAGPLRRLFAEVAAPVAEENTQGAFLGPWRLMSIDGSNGTRRTQKKTLARSGMRARIPATWPGRRSPRSGSVTVSECGSHAAVDAEIGGVAGKGAGEQSLARRLYRRLRESRDGNGTFMGGK